MRGSRVCLALFAFSALLCISPLTGCGGKGGGPADVCTTAEIVNATCGVNSGCNSCVQLAWRDVGGSDNLYIYQCAPGAKFTTCRHYTGGGLCKAYAAPVLDDPITGPPVCKMCMAWKCGEIKGGSIVQCSCPDKGGKFFASWQVWNQCT